jgi:hypothetical protein
LAFPLAPEGANVANMNETLSAVAEALWWALVAGLATAFVINAARKWLRDRSRSRADRLEAGVGPVIRKFEEEQLARMAAEGLPLWRPDPAKLKRISERQD